MIDWLMQPEVLAGIFALTFVIAAALGIALCVAGARDDEMVARALHADEFGDECDAVAFDFPDRRVA